MADTEFSSLTPTNTIAAGDSLVVVRGGLPYRFTGTLPALDASGNLTVGRSVYGSNFGRLTAANRGDAEYAYATMECVNASGATHFVIFNGTITAASAAATVALIGKNGSTGRSINAAGTINTSGADYAEYMRKAVSALAATILKGQVCGVDNGGCLTLRWSEAHSYVLKSTDPSLVGGETWTRHLPPKPAAPAPIGPEPIAPVAPGARIFLDAPLPEHAEGETVELFRHRLLDFAQAARSELEERAVYERQLSAFPDQHAEWIEGKAAFDAAQSQYAQQLPIWEAALEEARATVDRIAFSGQVPAIVTGNWAPGDYLIAMEGPDDTIIAVAVPDAEITFAQYRRSLGKVWAVTEERREDRDGVDTLIWPAGMAWVDVQHG